MNQHRVHESLASILETCQFKLVLAESCTGGRAAALLTEVPGISRWFCGSAVTYREPTKTAWLQVDPEWLATWTAESQQASDAMAIAVLKNTPEANLSCAITGHLGPNVDPNIDGLVYLSIAVLTHDGVRIAAQKIHRLQTTTRTDRQQEAAEQMLAEIADYLKNQSSSKPL